MCYVVRYQYIIFVDKEGFMKRIVAIAVLMAFVVNCTSPYVLPKYEYTTYEPEKIVIIHEQVGDTIDADEGQGLGLFTAIEGFRSARFYAVENGGYAIEIETETEKFTALNGDPRMLVMLNAYIDDYDEISIDPAAFEIKWGILDYDTLGIPITETEANTGIHQADVKARKNCLSCCGGSSLFAILAAAVAVGSVDTGSSDMAPVRAGMAFIVVLGAGALIGMITAGTVYYTTKKDAKAIIKQIKEARKPRVIEGE
jgi:hypothetical protein